MSLKQQLLIVLFSLVILTFAKRDTIYIQTAFENKKVKLDILGRGAYQGTCISMQVKTYTQIR